MGSDRKHDKHSDDFNNRSENKYQEQCMHLYPHTDVHTHRSFSILATAMVRSYTGVSDSCRDKRVRT